MKKEYMIPELETIDIKMNNALLAGSGVTDGSTPGEGYNPSDPTYAPVFTFDE